MLKVTYSQGAKKVIWGKFQHLLRKKNFLEYFLSVSFLLSSSSADVASLKSKIGLRGKGRSDWVSVESSLRDYGWDTLQPDPYWELSTRIREVRVIWPEAAAAFFYSVSFKARSLCSLWISSVENLSLINNCLCWIYRWAKLFSLMLHFSTFSFSGLCEHWHSKEINLSLR